jgi:hypothetical protein
VMTRSKRKLSFAFREPWHGYGGVVQNRVRIGES